MDKVEKTYLSEILERAIKDANYRVDRVDYRTFNIRYSNGFGYDYLTVQVKELR